LNNFHLDDVNFDAQSSFSLTGMKFYINFVQKLELRRERIILS